MADQTTITSRPSGSWGSRASVLARAATLLLGAALGTACAYRTVPHLQYSTSQGIEVPAPPDDKAQVVFWVAFMQPDIELAVYDERTQLGLLRYSTWFPVLVEPGDHRFAVVSDQSADFTVGHLQGGRTYILEAQNIWERRFRLQPVTPDMSSYGAPLANQMRGPYRVSPNTLTTAENDRLSASRSQTRERYYEKWLTKPEGDRRRILPEHALRGPLSYPLER